MNGSTDSPMDGIDFPVGAIAADVVMSAELTPFLAGASAQGNRTHAGAHMLAGQARLIADYLAGPREN
jgi:shikimate 5-dehydrogenase